MGKGKMYKNITNRNKTIAMETKWGNCYTENYIQITEIR